MATPVSTNSWILVVTGEPRMRHEVDSNFFELLTLYPPPRPVALGEHTHQCKGGKKGDSKYCRWLTAMSWVSCVQTTIILKIESLRGSKYIFKNKIFF